MPWVIRTDSQGRQRPVWVDPAAPRPDGGYSPQNPYNGSSTYVPVGPDYVANNWETQTAGWYGPGGSRVGQDPAHSYEDPGQMPSGQPEAGGEWSLARQKAELMSQYQTKPPSNGNEWTPDMSQLDWLVAQQQRRNPFREAMRLAKSGGYGQDVTASDAMRGAGANALGAMRDIKARDAQARTLDAALGAAPTLQGQRDSAIGQLLGTKSDIQMRGLQLQTQEEMFEAQLAQSGQQYDQTRRDNRRNAYLEAGTAILTPLLTRLLFPNQPGDTTTPYPTLGGGYDRGFNGGSFNGGYGRANDGPMPIDAGGVGLDYSSTPQGSMPPALSMYQPRRGSMPSDAGDVGLDYNSAYSSPYLINYGRPQAGTDSYRIRR